MDYASTSNQSLLFLMVRIDSTYIYFGRGSCEDPASDATVSDVSHYIYIEIKDT